MSSKDFNNSEEVTKEVLNLDELNEEALEKLEDTYQDIMDENLIESDLQFQEQIESLEIPEDTVIIEEPEEPKKKRRNFLFMI